MNNKIAAAGSGRNIAYRKRLKKPAEIVVQMGDQYG
jgi:hypothetical protein